MTLSADLVSDLGSQSLQPNLGVPGRAGALGNEESGGSDRKTFCVLPLPTEDSGEEECKARKSSGSRRAAWKGREASFGEEGGGL